MRVRLEGITLKGKNKVRQHGEIWNILETRTRVECLGGKIGFLVESLCNTFRVGNGKFNKDKRWVAIQGDVDFKVEVIQ